MSAEVELISTMVEKKSAPRPPIQMEFQVICYINYCDIYVLYFPLEYFNTENFPTIITLEILRWLPPIYICLFLLVHFIKNKQKVLCNWPFYFLSFGDSCH